MHWRNSNFQYAYFIFGACHTYIEAHRKCMEAIEERELALEQETPVITKYVEDLLRQAKDELAFLLNCKALLEEQIGRIPDMSDYQNNQREEWKLELIHRAENMMLCTGTISPDHFVTMRMHPDFETEIYTAAFTNLTSILFQATTSNGIGVGSRIRLYRKK